MDDFDPDDNRLYYSLIGGVGQLHCRKCGHTESIVSFEHGAPGEWCNTGLQCQTCGHLASLEEFGDGRRIEHFCDCPTAPTRDDPLFCPACRSLDLDYAMEYIT